MVYDDLAKIDYRISPILENLSLLDDEVITTISTYENNIYLGTSIGNLLHFHKFEDSTEYIGITTLEVSPHSISKIICVPDIQRLILVSNRVTTAYTLPELSPCHMKKMKDVNDLYHLDTDRILVLSPTKLRIIRLQQDQISLSREINYANGTTVKSSSSHKSNYIAVANNQNYDIIDLENNRKVPLFDYKTDTTSDIKPIIVPFDDEYLLTVSSDTNTSMAMFISTAGDVTRGTLTWVDEGYPQGGIVIESSYVFALFNKKIIVSSLDSLESVVQMDHDNDDANRIIKVDQAFIEDEELKELIGSTIQPIPAHIVLTNGKSVLGVHRKHKLVKLQQQVLNVLENQGDWKSLQIDPTEFMGELQSYAYHLLLLQSIVTNHEVTTLQVLNRENNGVLEISPDFVIYLIGEGEKPEVLHGLESILEKWTFSKDTELLKKYIRNLKQDYLSDKLELLYYDISSEAESLDFIKSKNWTTYDEHVKSIIELLTKKDRFVCVSEIFKSLGLVDDYVIFLNAHLSNDILDDTIQLVLSEKLNESQYAKTLINIINFDKPKGYEVLRNAPKKYQAINNSIMKDLSEEDSNQDRSFALLQVELMEKAFRENSNLQDELFELLRSILQLMYDEVKDDFDLLHKEFLQMNSLEKNKWPKIPWLDFLRICGKSKDLAIFVDFYLKSFELQEGKITDDPIFVYHRLFTKSDIPGLLEYGDYTTAERLASGENPYPKKYFYKEFIFTPTEPNEEKLRQVLTFYLSKYTSNEPVAYAVKHFAETYSKNIPILDFLNLIPDNFPIAYLTDYFKITIKDINETYRDGIMTKSIAKAEALRTRKLSKDLS